MKICIFGAGAIGGLLGVKLARSGHDVSFVARGAHLEALRRNGATLLTDGHTLTVQAACSDRPADLGPQDLVILAVKAHFLDQVVREIDAMLEPATMIMTVQNGLPWWYFQRHGGQYDGQKLESFLSGMIQVYGPDLLRYKGILWMKGNPRRVVFQGVHMMMGGDLGKPWAKGEKKGSLLVFIGKKLPKDLFIAGLEECLAK